MLLLETGLSNDSYPFLPLILDISCLSLGNRREGDAQVLRLHSLGNGPPSLEGKSVSRDVLIHSGFLGNQGLSVGISLEALAAKQPDRAARE